jgi:hypothetical protein
MQRLLIAMSLSIICASAARAQEASALPTTALKAYCEAAGDSLPAVFGDGRHGSPTAWRCVHGAVFVRQPGADGVACSARSRSRVPLPSMVESCRDYGYLPVSSGAFGYVWRWDCQKTRARYRRACSGLGRKVDEI